MVSFLSLVESQGNEDRKMQIRKAHTHKYRVKCFLPYLIDDRNSNPESLAFLGQKLERVETVHSRTQCCVYKIFPWENRSTHEKVPIEEMLGKRNMKTVVALSIMEQRLWRWQAESLRRGAVMGPAMFDGPDFSSNLNFYDENAAGSQAWLRAQRCKEKRSRWKEATVDHVLY